jgi:transposase
MAHGRYDLTEFEWNVIKPLLRTRRGAFQRNLVERCINKLKQFRHIATRYDRYASAYLAFAKLGAIRLWLRFYESAA